LDIWAETTSNAIRVEKQVVNWGCLAWNYEFLNDCSAPYRLSCIALDVVPDILSGYFIFVMSSEMGRDRPRNNGILAWEAGQDGVSPIKVEQIYRAVPCKNNKGKNTMNERVDQKQIVKTVV
jgi:hypothetical protein